MTSGLEHIRIIRAEGSTSAIRSRSRGSGLHQNKPRGPPCPACSLVREAGLWLVDSLSSNAGPLGSTGVGGMLFPAGGGGGGGGCVRCPPRVDSRPAERAFFRRLDSSRAAGRQTADGGRRAAGGGRLPLCWRLSAAGSGSISGGGSHTQTRRMDDSRPSWLILEEQKNDGPIILTCICSY